MSAMKRVLVLALVLVAVGAAAWYGRREWDRGTDAQSTDDAYVRGEITVLSPRVAGYAVEILADDNMPVEAKQVLVRLDPRDYRAAVQRAQAMVGQTDAQFQQAKEVLDLQQRQIEVAEAALESAEAQAKNAEITLSRARELLARGAGTQAAFDTTTAADVTSRSQVAQARAQLDYQRQQVKVLDANVRVAQTRIDDARAQLGTAQLALEDTEIWAPLAGTVANRRTRVGEFVTVGARMLSIVPRDRLWIEANFRETQLERMRPDQPVAIDLDTFGGKRICGYVEAVGPASGSEFALVPADNATGNFTKVVRRFPVRIRPNSSDLNAGLMRPGMSASVRVTTGASAAGCSFDPTKDRQPAGLPALPAHPGLSREPAAAVLAPAAARAAP